MLIEPTIGGAYQISVELILRDSGFVAANQQNGLAVRVKRKGNPPSAVIGAKTKLLHIRKF
jgi:hypothetical protein